MIDIKTILSQGYQRLEKIKIVSDTLDAELLLSFVLEKPREYVLAHPEIILTKKQIKTFNELVAKRARHVPVAYLTHEKEFYGRPFYVDERVLVPRPETEMIIDEIKNKKLEAKSKTVIVDIGAGSGCIIITLVKESNNYKFKIKNLKFIAIDVSKDALAVARKNARRHGVNKRITFLHGNLLKPLLQHPIYNIPARSATRPKLRSCWRVAGGQHLIITANLPYVTPTELSSSPSLKHEPRLALAAGGDGLKYYKKLGVQAQSLNIKYPNTPISIVAEIGETQGKDIKQIFSFAQSVKIKKDLAGRDRLAVIRL